MSKKRVLANLTTLEQAALIRRAKANRRSAAEEAGLIIGQALSKHPGLIIDQALSKPPTPIINQPEVLA